MSRDHAYPPDLATYVEEHWPAGRALSVSRGVLREALAVCFQASLTSEESRPTRFRLLLTPPELLPETGVPNEGVLRLRFNRTRPLTADELRRLGPASPFETSLICAYPEPGPDAQAAGAEGKLRIWGLAHSGPAWLAPTWGGRSLVPNWTYDPIIHATSPGHLAVRSAGKLVGALERGELRIATIDVFESEWFSALFAREREQIRAEHAAVQARTLSPTLADHSLVGRVGQHMLRRVIQLVRGAGHGGMILIVDDPTSGTRGEVNRGGLRLKYCFDDDEPARRYRGLLLQILERVAAATSKASVGWMDFAQDESQSLEKLEQAVFELSRVISNLAAIDGAVVLDKHFGIVGFGTEVSPELPAPTRVLRALDTDARACVPDDMESVGTRHRAAYRFVHDHPGGLAIVISHDGGVSFVANRDGEVVFWEQFVGP